MKPNLDVFRDPRFGEWRRGDDVCGSIEGNVPPFWCLLDGVADFFLGLFGK